LPDDEIATDLASDIFMMGAFNSEIDREKSPQVKRHEALPDDGTTTNLESGLPMIGALSTIQTQNGRLMISLRIEGGATGTKKCVALQTALEKGENLEELKNMQIWDVEFSHSSAEDKIPSDGFCGYVAMDQIMSQNSQCANIYRKVDRERICENLKKLLRERREIAGKKEILIPQNDEVETRTNGVINRLTNNETQSLTKTEFWLSIGLIVGRGAHYGFSSWSHDGRKLRCIDSQISKAEGRPGSPYNAAEWEQIIQGSMLCHKDYHFYIRKGGLLKNFRSAMNSIIRKVDKSWQKGNLKSILEEMMTKTISQLPHGSQVEDLEREKEDGGGSEEVEEGLERNQESKNESQEIISNQRRKRNDKKISKSDSVEETDLKLNSGKREKV
jgi:hypothetical protein